MKKTLVPKEVPALEVREKTIFYVNIDPASRDFETREDAEQHMRAVELARMIDAEGIDKDDSYYTLEISTAILKRYDILPKGGVPYDVSASIAIAMRDLYQLALRLNGCFPLPQSPGHAEFTAAHDLLTRLGWIK